MTQRFDTSLCDRNFAGRLRRAARLIQAGAKDATMYSTYDGARRCAKKLQRQLENSFMAFPLSKCQAAVARACGFRDWHDMQARIATSGLRAQPYDYVSGLAANLPEPCRYVVMADANGTREPHARKDAEAYRWITDVSPYVMAMEVVHRVHSPLVRPGSGKDQRLRHHILSNMLLDCGAGALWPVLDPEALTLTLPGHPRALVPDRASHPGFDQAIMTLSDAGIIAVEEQAVRIFAPSQPELRDKLLTKARLWGSARTSDGRFVKDAIQNEAPRAPRRPVSESGHAKLDFDEIFYRGLSLSSRYSLIREFETMKAIVDVMPTFLRASLLSIWCNSKACADYRVEIAPEQYHPEFPSLIRDAFLEGSAGFNGLWIAHGAEETSFDPEWPDDEIERNAA